MAKANTKKYSKEPPAGVKVISILYYIGAALSVIFGLLAIVAGPFVLSYISGLLEVAEAAAVIGTIGIGVVIFLGIVAIAIAILDFFVARGLWKAQGWARIVAIIFAVFGVLSGLNTLFSGAFGSGLVNIVISGLIGWYLWFSDAAKAYFR